MEREEDGVSEGTRAFDQHVHLTKGRARVHTQQSRFCFVCFLCWVSKTKSGERWRFPLALLSNSN